MMGCDWVLAGGGDAVTGVVVVWLVGRFANRPYGLVGGFIDGQVWVVDEGVSAVMGGLVVWLLSEL